MDLVGGGVILYLQYVFSLKKYARHSYVFFARRPEEESWMAASDPEGHLLVLTGQVSTARSADWDGDRDREQYWRLAHAVSRAAQQYDIDQGPFGFQQWFLQAFWIFINCKFHVDIGISTNCIRSQCNATDAGGGSRKP